MCTASPESPPWSIIHFLLISLTAFSSHRYLFYGAQVILVEFVMIIVLVTPVLFVQLKLGGMVQRSLYGLFHKYFPFLRGVAVAVVVQLLVYQMILPSIPVHFICAGFASVSGEREKMASCANRWNTASCRQSGSNNYFPDGINSTTVYDEYDSDYNFQPLSSPIQEYFSRRFYQRHSVTPGELGGFPGFPTFPLVLTLTWVFLCLSVAFGPRIFAWVISIVGVLSTVMMIGVLGYGWNVVAEALGRNKAQGLLYYYLPNFQALINGYEWIEATKRVIWFIPITFGILPTMGKFVGEGKVIRNISWIFVVFITIILRNLPPLTISPYQSAASYHQNVPMQEYMTRFVTVEGAMTAFIHSKSSPSASLFYFSAIYLHYFCGMALALLVIVDNFIEAFEWLFKKCGCNRRVVWFVTTVVISIISFLLGLPFLTKGGLFLLGIFDGAIILLDFVTKYFLGIGILAIYIWQNIATAERFIIGIWSFFTLLVTVLLGIIDTIRRRELWTGGYVLSQEENRRWWKISWGIASCPVYFIPIGMIIFIIMFVIQKMRSGNIPFNQPLSNEEDVLLKRKTGDESHPEDVQRVSSF